jgi:hypothetical protein
MKYERVDRPDADPIIERGIPLPALERAKYRKNSWARITDMMEVGDSVQVNTLNEAIAFCLAISKSGGCSAKRSVGARFRVWRTS